MSTAPPALVRPTECPRRRTAMIPERRCDPATTRAPGREEARLMNMMIWQKHAVRRGNSEAARAPLPLRFRSRSLRHDRAAMLLRRWTFASRVDSTYVRRRWRPRPTRALSPAQEIEYACGSDAVMRAIESRQHSQLTSRLQRQVSESKCDPCVAPAPEPPELAPGKPPIGVRYDRACLVSHSLFCAHCTLSGGGTGG